ncbi:P27 family phage terminase small subunit [Ruminococcus sp.]|uniref:P27 family phage terminase small subunit n=1 Tax=Ruminococcus sp. TaxID=41978 RepID=UPI001B6C9BF1|nr:P27 family phage terminase small subunit [Ruminococcus sp.]MBP5431563.1 P27 family phage terminase small subunit [Ruminococcus sp.]
MARPTKSAAMTTGTYRKDVLESRQNKEELLKGTSSDIKPPEYLTESQRSIFQYIVTNLEASGILGNLDVYVLAECSICIDRMQEIERSINEKGLSGPLVRLKDSYTKAFFRYCNELSLSPQSRAKLANINAQAAVADENPLLKALSDDE